jgi:Cu/Ag efflux pump CusA
LPALEQAAWAVAGTAGHTPGFTQAYTLFNTRTPQIYADIDRTKAEQLGVPISRVFETLSVYMGSAFVNDFNILGRTYRVTAQADDPFRLTLRDVANLKTRNVTGDMVPIGAVATFSDTTGPYRVPRYNLYPAAEVQLSLARGFSSGQGLAAVESIAAEKLPSGFGFEWTEIALQEKLAGNTAMAAFGLAVVFVFLLLAALYESWLLPLAVILIVPMCILAAMTGVNLRGLDRNILVEIGLVVLVGLAAKNAILIVEFAKQAEEQGMSRYDAAVAAARTRLRPILMTSLAFILGVLPLAVAVGAGAEMRQSLGTAVFSGMLGVTLFGLLGCRCAAGDRRLTRRRASNPASWRIARSTRPAEIRATRPPDAPCEAYLANLTSAVGHCQTCGAGEPQTGRRKRSASTAEHLPTATSSNPDEPNTAHRPPWHKGKLGLKIVSAISASAPKMGDLWDRISPRSLSACLSFLSEAAQTFATVVSQVGSWS